MKTTKNFIVIILIAYLLSGFFSSKTHPLLNAKIEYLQNEGYQPKAAEHIAKVELKLIPEDSEYIALMED